MAAGNIRGLIAAFAFGIAVNAASVALFLYIKGHGSSFLRDGPRLVLITFFATSALWAQTDFITTLINLNSTTGCQVTIVFASAFDQLARSSLMQGLLWEVNNKLNVSSIEVLLSQGLVFLRFVIGVVFVGVQRPQLETVCVARTSVLPLGVIVVVLDALLIVGLLARTALAQRSKQNKDTTFAIAGWGIWTSTSAPMIIGSRSIDLLARTAIPAAGLVILIGILVLVKESLLSRNESSSTARFDSPISKEPEIARQAASRDVTTIDSLHPSVRSGGFKPGTLTSIVAGPGFQPRPGELKGGLPLITRPNAGQAVTGMGGVPVQGRLFPPLRIEPEPTAPRIEERGPRLIRKKSDKLTISNPILEAGHASNPLQKIATVDLETAAKHEKERRGIGQLSNHTDEIIRSQSLKVNGSREQTPLRRTQSSLHPPTGMGSSASTTSAQLSPGVEEIRRRSPGQVPRGFRQKALLSSPDQISRTFSSTSGSPPKRPTRPPTLEFPTLSPGEIAARSIAPSSPRTKASLEEKTAVQKVHENGSKDTAVPIPPEPLQRRPTLESVTSSSSDQSIAFRKSILPRNNSVKMNVRPSRQRPPSQPLGEPLTKAKTPVQMRAKTGLPSNPRAHAVLALARENEAVREQQMAALTHGAEIGGHETPHGKLEGNIMETPDPEHGRVPSVVHRPRPIPRKPEVDRAIFPAEGSPNMHEHKRSLSSGSAGGRKSVLNPASSAERQPALPQLPKNAGALSRPQPNNTMSMTWHERVKMYCTQPLTAPGSPTGLTEPSPRPEMEAMLAVQGQDRNVGFGTGLHTADISSEQDMILATFEAPIPPFVTRNESKFSITTYQSTADGRGLRASQRTAASHMSDEGVKRRSSPVLPSMEYQYSPSLSSKGEESGDDETATNWGSVHSPAKAVNVQLARAVEVPAVPKFIQSQDDDNVVQAKSASELCQDDNKETMTVMLDPSLSWDVRSVQGPRQGIGSRALWHRRVGDVCPTFSEGRRTRKLRKAPPPAPLSLSTVPMIIQAEPSPLESPRHALELINAQLSQLENASVGSNDLEVQRMTLLADLEMEMGLQENQWQQMRHTLISRDSFSTLEPSPNPGVEAAREGEPTSISSRGHNFNWQQKLVEAQMEYCISSPIPHKAWMRKDGIFGKLPEFPAGATTKGMNSLVVSTTSKMHLGSPTPPDTDESGSEYEEVDEVLHVRKGVASEVGVGGLWQPPRPTTSDVARATAAFLWTPGPKKAEPQGVSAVENSTGFTRRRARRDEEPLTIESSRLWEKPVSNQRFSIGLWSGATPVSTTPANSKPEKATTTPTRAVAQRPPRRGRRVTMLPDILESPKPLPDKRGTLGIFQFPWGDVSDNATMRPAMQPGPRMYMSMPGTMLSGGGPVINRGVSETHTPSQRIVSSELGEYSQSFFDDYEMEDEGDNLDDYEYDDNYDYGDVDVSDEEVGYGDDEFDDDKDMGDDDFDETTLREIASLLKSDGVPSRDSLFPTAASGSQDSSSHGQGTPHQEKLTLGNLGGHGDRAKLGTNAGLGVPSGNERDELRDGDGESGCDSVTDIDIDSCSESDSDSDSGDDDDDGGANPSVLEIANGFPPPPRPSAQRWTNGLRVTAASRASARRGVPDAVGAVRISHSTVASTPAAPAAAPGPAPCPAPGSDAQSWEAPLAVQRALASASDWTETDSVHFLARKPEPRLVEKVGGGVEDGAPGGDSISLPDNETLPWPISAPIARVNNGTPPTKLQGPHNHKRQPVVTKNSQWTPSPVKTPPANGLAQPDDQAWLTSLASLASTQALVQPYITESHERSPAPPALSTSLPSLQSSQSSPDITKDKDDTASEQLNLLWNPIISLPAHINSMALWSPTAPIHVSPKGLPQPDTALWDNYLSSVDHTVRVAPRKAEAATIESASLWSPTPKTVEVAELEAPHIRTGLWGTKKQQQQQQVTASAPSLWAQPSPVEKVSYGLSQPEHHVWSSYLPAEEEVLRVKTRESTPASIESDALWSPPPPRTTMSGSPDSLWSASKISAITTEAESSPAASSPAPSAAANYGLWTRPVPVQHEEPRGLFSVNHKRSDFRSTSSPPAALDMPRKRRAALEPYPDFVFSYLWNENPLWRGPPPVIEEQAEGLFSLGHRRVSYRTTDQPPAALSVLRKPRISNEPLPKLTSNSLWSVPATRPVEYDWLKLSTTVGPKTASTVSSASDNESLSTVASSVDEDDAASIKSAISNIEKVLGRIEATATEWKDALNEAITASKQTTKSALWARPSKPAAVDSATATSEYTSMWQPSPPSNADSVDTEPEYTVAEPDEERSTTFRYRRKSDDQVEPGPMSPSNFFLLSTPETPRDFSAQALWTHDGEEAYAAEEQTWLDESALRMSRVQMQLS